MKLEIRNLRKTYGKVKALDSVSFVMKEGIYGVLGPNGAGKSTLINLLTDNVKRESGEILLDGKDILEWKHDYLNILGYMPQDQGFYEDFSVKAFLMYIGKLKGLPRRELKEKTERMIDSFNLRSFCNKKVGSLSGGMRQRVLLAQTLLNDPKILILDEPTAGVDPQERINIRNIISKQAEGRIIIIATHIVSDIESIANEIVLMKSGNVIEKDTPYHLIEKVGTKVFEIHVNKEQLQEVQDKYIISNIQYTSGGYQLKIVGDCYDGEFGNGKAIANLDDVYLYHYQGTLKPL